MFLLWLKGDKIEPNDNHSPILPVLLRKSLKIHQKTEQNIKYTPKATLCTKPNNSAV